MSLIKLLVMAPCDPLQRETLLRRCQNTYSVTFLSDHDPARRSGLISQANVIIGEPDMEEIQNLPGLRWIQMTWAGMDKYTRNPGFPENVLLTNASGAFGVIISEYVLAGILTLYRHLPTYRTQQHQRVWRDAGREESLFGKRVLILGTGNIGSETAKRLKPFGTTISGIRRTPAPVEYFDEIHTLDELDTELPRADVVIGCLPNADDTIGLLNEDRLRAMKPNALLVNVGRGLLIPAGALERVLSDGHLFGAVLDVMHHEPLPADNPLWGMDNVLLTPHISGKGFDHCKDTENRIWDICIENLERFANGEPLRNLWKMHNA